MPDDGIQFQTIQVSALTPTIGAEIFGADLSKSLTTQQFDEIHAAWMRHLVVFFRDQQFTIEQHKAFGRRFGDLEIHPTTRMAGHPEIIEIKADENSKYVAGKSGIPTSAAIRFRPWALSSICTGFLRTAAETRCSATCTGLTRRCRRQCVI